MSRSKSKAKEAESNVEESVVEEHAAVVNETDRPGQLARPRREASRLWRQRR